MEWLDDDTGNWGKAIGCRWIGDINDPSSIGHSNSFNNAVWFILPQPLQEMASALIEAAGVSQKT
jgi:hypothetical protein